MYQWPLWRPRQTIPSSALIGWEDLFLQGISLEAAPDHGVMFMELGRSVSFVRAGDGKITARASGILGLTPGGLPIAVGPLPGYRWSRGGHVPLESTFRPGRRNDTDLWIEFAGREEPAACAPPGGGPLAKLELIATPAERGQPAPELDVWRLYLGRYRLQGETIEALQRPILRPLVRRFDALHPHDESWREWAMPFEFAVGAAVQTLEEQWHKERGMIEPRVARALDVALDLEAGWTRLGWGQIAQGAELIRTLRGISSRAAESDQPAPLSAAWNPAHASGEDQARALAAFAFSESGRPEWRVYELGRRRDGRAIYVIVEDDLEVPHRIRCRITPPHFPPELRQLGFRLRAPAAHLARVYANGHRLQLAECHEDVATFVHPLGVQISWLGTELEIIGPPDGRFHEKPIWRL